MTLRQLHELHIQGTKEKSLVVTLEIVLCGLTIAVCKIIVADENLVETSNVYINTRILKHLYDKKPAEEFDKILDYAEQIAQYPDQIFINKDSKRGDFLFLKQIEEETWVCAIQKGENGKYFLVTCFRLRNSNYLNGYNLIWSWKVGKPSS